jgi:hypothetical protein
MNIQPIDLPSLVRALIWPLIALIAFVAFRHHMSDLLSILGQRVRTFSFGGVSLELAEVSELKPPPSLDTEIRQLDAGLIPQSGVTGLTALLQQLQSRGKHDYIVIDLGSESSPRPDQVRRAMARSYTWLRRRVRRTTRLLAVSNAMRRQTNLN